MGTFDPAFWRNRSLRRLLDLNGETEVWIVNEPLWNVDRVGVAQSGWLKIAFRMFVTYPRLLTRLLLHPAPDVYLVSYPGWLDVIALRPIGWLKQTPIVFDPFVSVYDTLVEDRKFAARGSVKARTARLLDRLSLRLADVVLADTHAHLDFFEGISPGTVTKGSVLPVGADDEIFRASSPTRGERLVVFYGSYVPLQGVSTIIEAARLLEHSGVRILMIGDGQGRPSAEDLAERLGVQNIDWIDFVPLEVLPSLVAPALACLGIFGESDKADRVVPHKVFECLAMGRPVITRDSAAIAEMFGEGELVTVPPADPIALAHVIRELVDDPDRRRDLASAGLAAYRLRFSDRVRAEILDCVLRGGASPERGPQSK